MFEDEVLVFASGLRDLAIAIRRGDCAAAEAALDIAIGADDDAKECVANARATVVQVAA